MASLEQGRAALERLESAGREIPVVESYVVGQDVGDGYDFGAVLGGAE